MVYKDQLFRMHFDNRRVLDWATTIPSSLENLVDSHPLENINQGKNLRFIGRMYKNKLYGKHTSVLQSVKKYKNKEEMVIRNFLKGLLSTPPKFNLNRRVLLGYKDIVEYMLSYNPSLKITVSSLAYLKHSNKEGSLLPVKKTNQSESFVKFVKLKFKDFDVEEFYGEK